MSSEEDEDINDAEKDSDVFKTPTNKSYKEVEGTDLEWN